MSLCCCSTYIGSLLLYIRESSNLSGSYGMLADNRFCSCLCNSCLQLWTCSSISYFLSVWSRAQSEIWLSRECALLVLHVIRIPHLWIVIQRSKRIVVLCCGHGRSRSRSRSRRREGDASCFDSMTNIATNHYRHEDQNYTDDGSITVPNNQQQASRRVRVIRAD